MARALTPSPFEESRASRLGKRAVLWFILGEVYLPRNHEPVFDPRPQSGSVVLTIDPGMLAEFDPGPAVLRASAVGRPQWLRVPPPTVRELPITISK